MMFSLVNMFFFIYLLVFTTLNQTRQTSAIAVLRHYTPEFGQFLANFVTEMPNVSWNTMGGTEHVEAVRIERLMFLVDYGNA